MEPFQRQLNDWFTHLHTHPEVSWEEYETTQFLIRTLTSLGLTPQPFETMTGLYVDIGEGTPRVGLRADIDALYQEVNGTFRANHSCGHDGHMTMALGVAYYFTKIAPPREAVRLIFQPAEEKGTGAKAVLQTGVIDSLDVLFGAHVRPLVELEDGQHAPAIYHGAAKQLSGRIEGKQAHGARPELGVNAIEVGAAFITALKSLWTDPNVSSSVKVTQFEAGGDATNIIPGVARFKMDARAATNEAMDDVTENVHAVARHLSALYDADITISEDVHIAAAVVDDEAKSWMARAIVDVAGEEALAPPITTPGGEDFHFYTLERPTLQATMLGLGCGVTPGLHDPLMTFNTDQLAPGALILARAMTYALDERNDAR